MKAGVSDFVFGTEFASDVDFEFLVKSLLRLGIFAGRQRRKASGRNVLPCTGLDAILSCGVDVQWQVAMNVVFLLFWW